MDSIRSMQDAGDRMQEEISGLSISSKIAEGYERQSPKEVVNFLNYAKGSCGELRSQIYIGMKIGYIQKDAGYKWIKESERISKMLYHMIEKFKAL